MHRLSSDKFELEIKLADVESYKQENAGLLADITDLEQSLQQHREQIDNLQKLVRLV